MIFVGDPSTNTKKVADQRKTCTSPRKIMSTPRHSKEMSIASYHNVSKAFWKSIDNAAHLDVDLELNLIKNS